MLALGITLGLIGLVAAATLGGAALFALALNTATRASDIGRGD